mgnify:CR=1 FL=1|jgi:hypothetical protein
MTATDGLEASTVADLRAELEGLRRDYDELLNRDVATWLEQLRAEPGFVRDYERTLSWRITRPLRLARAFQVRLREDGVGPAVGQAVTVLKRSARRR